VISGSAELHHIGFVVANIERAMPEFVRSLQGAWDGRIWEDPHQKVKVAFLEVGPSSRIELVAPNGESSPVVRFLTERGGGLHHMCYEVDALDAEIAAMRARKALLARPPKPAVAFGGRRIAWLLTSEKLLIELLERSVQG
jgi:methylmalonyl-CoA/ethylmalonyl-CoA epimerase